MSTYQHSIKFSKKQTLEFQNSSRPMLELYYHWSDSLMPTTAEIIQAGRLNFNGGVCSLCFKASIHAKCDCKSSDTW